MRDSMTHGEALVAEKNAKLPWKEFHKQRFDPPVSHWFGVVTAEGEWVDSAITYHAALDFALQYEGSATSSPIEMLLTATELKCSVVECKLLERMYNAGLLK